MKTAIVTFIAVMYVGRQDPFIERNYRSGLTFAPNQVRKLPSDLAGRLLRHADVFKRVEPEATAETDKNPTSALLPVLDPDKKLSDQDQTNKPDDTQEQLAAAAAQKLKEDTALAQIQDAIQQVNLMDKDGLTSYAQTKYGQPLAKTLTVEKMRAKVVGMVQQFGLV